MVIRNHVHRHSVPACALHAAQEGSEHLPHEEHVACLPVALLVREVDEAVVVRVHGAPVGTADTLRSTGGTRAVGGTERGAER